MRRSLLALLFVVSAAQAQQVVTWGMESWTCGNAEFRVRLGTGRDVRLFSISGAVTASSSADDGVLRQSLLAIYPGVPLGRTSVARFNTPGTNHSIDEHIAAVNMKQWGAGAAPAVPVRHRFDPPLLVRDGDLRAVIVTQNYGGSNSAGCLDTEAQLTVVFE